MDELGTSICDQQCFFFDLFVYRNALNDYSIFVWCVQVKREGGGQWHQCSTH